MIDHGFHLPFGEVGRRGGRVGLRGWLDNEVGGVTFRFHFRRNAEHVPQSLRFLPIASAISLATVGSYAKLKIASHPWLPPPGRYRVRPPQGEVKERDQDLL